MMNHRLMTGLALLSVFVGCGGGGSTSGSGGAPSGSGGAGTGSGGATTGSGGATTGSGGASTGSGGAATGSGGATTGSGGAGTGTGGRATGGAAPGGTNGSGGAGGRAATGGAPASGGAGGASTTSNSVLERNNHPSRDGHFLQPMLTKTRAATLARDTTFAGTFTGNMWASPLYLENGPGGKGIFIAATTGNDVIALDETAGTVTWMAKIGTPSTSSATSGGQCIGGSIINPLGILSTPVIDAATKTIYVAGATGSASGITAHIATALSTDDGTVKAGWPIDLSTYANFDPKIHNQRSALSLVNNILYVAYGGFVGDCGQYKGRVVGVNTVTPTMRGNWATGGVGEGIWPPGGMASDGNGVFVVTGNSTNGTATHLDSEQVIRLTGLAAADKTNNTNVFFPASWRTMDSQDADFSAINPVYIEVPGATPSTMVVAIAKDGHMYLLDSKNLGGMGGQKVDFMVASGAMAIRTVPTAYRSSMGTHIAFSTDAGAMCPTGMPSGRVVMSVLIPAGAPPAPKVVWCAALSGQAAPIATTTDGTGDPIVWFMSNNRLVGVDGLTGAVIVNPTDTCMGVRKWTSPIAVKGRIVVGADGRLCSWSPH